MSHVCTKWPSHLDEEVPLAPDVLEEAEDVERPRGRALPQHSVDRDVGSRSTHAGAVTDGKKL